MILLIAAVNTPNPMGPNYQDSMTKLFLDALVWMKRYLIKYFMR